MTRDPRPRLPALLALASLCAATALAQETSTEEAPVEETGASGWTWSSRVEGGWRDLGLSGSESLYRTVDDDGEGLRLFSVNVDGTRSNDRGRFADTFTVRGFGFGGDADQQLEITLARRAAYRVSLDFGRSIQVYDVPSWQLGQHGDDRVRRTAGVRVDLYPGRSRAWVSWRVDELEGPSTTTQRQGSNQFLLDQHLDRDSQDIRVGGQIPAGPVTITLEQGRRTTDGTSVYSLADGAADGNQGSSTLGHYDRTTEESGTTDVSRVALQVPFKDRVDLSASYVHANGDGDSAASRDSLQTRPGPAGGIQRLLETDGANDRLARLAEVGVTVRLTKRLALDETFRMRTATTNGSLDLESTTITNGVANTSLSSALRRYVEDGTENCLDLLWRGGNGVNVRGGLRTSSRTLTWKDGETSEVDRDDARWFASASWRPGPKLQLQGEVERGDGSTDEIDPKVLARTLPLDSWSAGARLVANPSKATSLGFSVKWREGENPTATERMDDEMLVLAVQGSHSWGDKGEIRGSLSTARHDVSTLLDLTMDGARIQPTQDYRYRNTTFTLEGIARPSSRVTASLLFRSSDTSGSYPVRWQRIEPRVSFKTFRNLDLTVSWYDEKYDPEDYPDEDFRASGLIAWLTWAMGPGGWDGRYREKKP